MFDYKLVLSGIGVIIGLLGYLLYIRDTIRYNTRPHLFSWLIWTILELIALGIQITEGAGIGAAVSGVSALGCFVVMLLAIKKGEKSFPVIDWIFLASSLGALILWLVADQPVAATILIVTTDIFAFAPTFRKAYTRPHEETLLEYAAAGAKFVFGLGALRTYSLTTWLYPLYLVLANFSFVVFALIRRRQTKFPRTHN